MDQAPSKPLSVVANAPESDHIRSSTWGYVLRDGGACLEDNPSIQSVTIVSSPYHMRRAQWAFQKVLGERVRLQFAPVPFEMSSLEQRWWTDTKSRKMVVKEYLKILFYFVKHSLR